MSELFYILEELKKSHPNTPLTTGLLIDKIVKALEKQDKDNKKLLDFMPHGT